MRFIDIFPHGVAKSAARSRFRALKIAVVVALACVFLIGAFAAYYVLVPPGDFPDGELIEIPDDVTVREMGAILAARGAVRSSLAFKAYARITFQDRSLASGPFVFEKPLGLAFLTHRMANDKHGILPARVTFTEGMTVADMAAVLGEELPGFDATRFLELASASEGYLFPDTYFFLPDTEPEDVVERLRTHFDEQIATIEREVEASGRTLNEIVIMASLLEREAQGDVDMRTVSSILWKRFDSGMLLQVDAPFGFVRGQNGYTPTAADLASDSPYNTYMNPGLPAGPIANPGLVALRAATAPVSTPYLYYLTGRDGNMYYGRTFEDHKRNRELYLD